MEVPGTDESSVAQITHAISSQEAAAGRVSTFPIINLEDDEPVDYEEDDYFPPDPKSSMASGTLGPIDATADGGARNSDASGARFTEPFTSTSVVRIRSLV